MKKIFSWNCIFGSCKLFPSSKIDFWSFLKLQKMEFGQKELVVKLIYLISRVCLTHLFLPISQLGSWNNVAQTSVFVKIKRQVCKSRGCLYLFHWVSTIMEPYLVALSLCNMSCGQGMAEFPKYKSNFEKFYSLFY